MADYDDQHDELMETQEATTSAAAAAGQAATTKTKEELALEDRRRRNRETQRAIRKRKATRLQESEVKVVLQEGELDNLRRKLEASEIENGSLKSRIALLESRQHQCASCQRPVGANVASVLGKRRASSDNYLGEEEDTDEHPSPRQHHRQHNNTSSSSTSVAYTSASGPLARSHQDAYDDRPNGNQDAENSSSSHAEVQAGEGGENTHHHHNSVHTQRQRPRPRRATRGAGSASVRQSPPPASSSIGVSPYSRPVGATTPPVTFPSTTTVLASLPSKDLTRTSTIATNTTSSSGPTRTSSLNSNDSDTAPSSPPSTYSSSFSGPSSVNARAGYESRPGTFVFPHAPAIGSPLAIESQMSDLTTKEQMHQHYQSQRYHQLLQADQGMSRPRHHSHSAALSLTLEQRRGSMVELAPSVHTYHSATCDRECSEDHERQHPRRFTEDRADSPMAHNSPPTGTGAYLRGFYDEQPYASRASAFSHYQHQQYPGPDSSSSRLKLPSISANLENRAAAHRDFIHPTPSSSSYYTPTVPLLEAISDPAHHHYKQQHQHSEGPTTRNGKGKSISYPVTAGDYQEMSSGNSSNGSNGSNETMRLPPPVSSLRSRRATPPGLPPMRDGYDTTLTNMVSDRLSPKELELTRDAASSSSSSSASSHIIPSQPLVHSPDSDAFPSNIQHHTSECIGGKDGLTTAAQTEPVSCCNGFIECDDETDRSFNGDIGKQKEIRRSTLDDFEELFGERPEIAS